MIHISELDTSLGQVFTPDSMVKKMHGLMQNNGRKLEPSCGDGQFLGNLFTDTDVLIEIDSRIAHKDALVMDFFEYPAEEQFDTIFSNFPYLAGKEIPTSTLNLLDFTLFTKKSNLYLFMFKKCVDHLNEGGELITIIPREVLTATSAVAFNNWLDTQGSYTFHEDCGDNIFDGASPDVVVLRFQKGLKVDKLDDGRTICLMSGAYRFLDKAPVHNKRLGDIFEVRVGAVSGENAKFYSPHGDIELVFSETERTGKTVTAISPEYGKAALLADKEYLQTKYGKGGDKWSNWTRKPKPFTGQSRIYVNTTTRSETPFFLHEADLWDGSVMALFIKDTTIPTRQYLDMLNSIDWDNLGFRTSTGRLRFSQKALQDAII